MMRQRLVGTLVLLCGGVILWSLLFTGPAEYKLDRTSQIPVAPRIDLQEDVEPQQPEGIPSALAPIVEPQPVVAQLDEEDDGGRFNGSGVKAAASPPSEAKERSAAAPAPKVATVEVQSKPKAESKPEAESKPVPPAEPSVEAKGLPVAWVIQCGSFGQQSNADKLVERMRQSGYKAYSEKVERRGTTLYRVLVGPTLNRERAEALRVEINRRFALKSILSRFEG